jgi:hypothetical protein
MGPRLLTPLLAGAVLGLGLWGAHGRMSAQPSDGPPGPRDRGGPGERAGPRERGGPPPGPDHGLRHAYDVLSEVSFQLAQAKEPLPRETPALFDKAKEIYRAAHKSFKDGDRERSAELARAANEAGRGLKHVLRASQPPVDDLPLPPEGADGPPPPPREGRRVQGPPRREGADGPPPPPRDGPGARGRPAPPEEDEDGPPPPPREGFDRPPPPNDEPEANGRPALLEEEEDGPPPPPPPGDRQGKRPPPPPDGDDGPPPPPRPGGSSDGRPRPPHAGGPGDGPPPSRNAADPWQPARHALQHAKERLDETSDATGTGKAFLKGARNAYTLARKAYTDGDYCKSTEFALGADAWTRVREHLQRAGYEGAALTTRRELSPPPPPDDGATGRRRLPPPGDEGPDGRRPGPGARPGRDSAPPPPPDDQRDGRRQPPPRPPQDDGPDGRKPPPPPPEE